MTGGPFNPLSMIYAVQVALAAVTLGAAIGWLMGTFAAGTTAILDLPAASAETPQ